MSAPLPLPGPIALRAATDAEANVGVQESGGENRGKAVETYLRAVGLPAGNPWCAAFVRYRLEAAAAALKSALPSSLPDSGWCPSYYEWARVHGYWIPVGPIVTAISDGRQAPQMPRRGDLCCFWFAAKGRHAHIGIVTVVEARGVRTVEGNTGPDFGTEVEREGDGVFAKLRRWSALGVRGGFVRLPF